MNRILCRMGTSEHKNIVSEGWGTGRWEDQVSVATIWSCNSLGTLACPTKVLNQLTWSSESNHEEEHGEKRVKKKREGCHSSDVSMQSVQEGLLPTFPNLPCITVLPVWHVAPHNLLYVVMHYVWKFFASCECKVCVPAGYRKNCPSQWFGLSFLWMQSAFGG